MNNAVFCYYLQHVGAKVSGNVGNSADVLRTGVRTSANVSWVRRCAVSGGKCYFPSVWTEIKS